MHSGDSGKFACRVFLDFQKAFDTVNDDIWLKKLDYYGICDKSNKWFKSFLEDRKQHITINKVRSSDNAIRIRVPQGLILGPTLFILFINDFHKAVEFSTVHHFADDSILLIPQNSLKKLYKHVNRDLKFVFQWIWNEIIFFFFQHKQCTIYNTTTGLTIKARKQDPHLHICASKQLISTKLPHLKSKNSLEV